MTICAFKWCHNSSENSAKSSGISFHRFPLDPVLSNYWIKNVRLSRRDEYWKPTKNTRVCSVHFENKYKYETKSGKCKLRRNAIPMEIVNATMTEDCNLPINIKQEPIVDPDPLDNVFANAEPTIKFVKVENDSSSLSTDCNLNQEVLGRTVDIKTIEAKECSEEPLEDLSLAEDTKFKYSARDCISETLYLCEFCHEYFTAYNLQEHIALNHGKDWKISCAVCGKDFLLKDGSKTMKCDECVKKISKRNGAVHRFWCQQCLKGFTQRCYLKRHMNIHNNYKPYSCEFCNKKFTERGNMRQHMVVHNNVRPHNCNYCSKTFATVKLLHKHIFQHTGDLSSLTNTYTCKICNRCFTFRHSLNRHMQRHTGERPFKCEICFKTFKQSNNLKRHARIHSGGLFQCDICGKKYCQKASVEYHIMRVHMEKESCQFKKEKKKEFKL